MNHSPSSLVISNRSSIVGIDLYEPSSNSIVVQRQNSENDEDQVCIYFPQFREVVYAKITATTKDFTLTDFVIDKLNHKNSSFIGKVDSDHDPFIVRQFDSKQKEIGLQVLVRWKRRFQVIFHKEIEPHPTQNTTCILIQTGKTPQQTLRINYEQYKKMRLRELFLYHRLAKYRYTSLSILGNIVKSHETLQGFQMHKGLIKAYPLISFQTFYHEMHSIYNKLKESDFDFQSLFNTLIQKNPSFQRMLREKYPLLKSTYIDQFTQYCILYFTSNFYKPQQQRQLLQSYSNGKIADPLNQPQIILVAFMLSRIEQLNNIGNYAKIYLIEKIQEEQNKNQFKIDEIIRFEAFAPAFSNRPQNIERKGCDIYQIQHLTSQQIGIYNGLHNNYNYIILPYTEYYVENIQHINGNKEIQLIQMSYPKYLDTDFVLWIDDKFRESLTFRNEHLIPNKNKIEIIFLKSNKLYEFWLRRHYNMLTFRRIKVITNMRRGEDDYAGIQTIRLTRLYLHSDVNIMMFVGRASECIQLLKDNNVQHYEEILVSDNRNVLKDFILSEERVKEERVKVEREQEMDNCNCSVKEGVKCEVF